ncbi:hydrogenase expression/formation protein HypE [Candidatus Clostridium radicumherbarum]|uniref:Hydrogenase expression/formation protein HypE n=1 Tax=Candidatus Clostridium radicumherbarum TaxID=3381662 RepID=A0ABW8TVF3_9CLOT
MEDIISISHGNGGKKTSKLIDEMIVPYFNNKELIELGDGALLNVSGDITFSTDSFVIDPYFFPGGNIGKLSICGTVNDLLMCGSVPKYISLGLILEEGLKLSDLESIIKSIADTALSAGVKVVTGDTKVVDKGHGHGIYINTAGIGEKIPNIELGKHRINKGDKVIVSGNVGNHGVAILCEREKLLDTNIISDCAVLNEPAQALLKFKENIKILRDPTRGGVATTLNEFVEKSNLSIEIEESAIPIASNVKTACDLLGLDPLYSANEGKILAVVDAKIANEALMELKSTELGKDAAIIGEVVDYMPSKVLLKSMLGGRRILDKLSYDILPRIC